MANAQPDRLIVAVSGASGTIYAVRALDILRSLGIETHLIVTKAGHLNRAYETDLTREDLESRADHVYNIHDVAAPISSGSYLTRGMLIAPASMRAVGEIANGVSASLLSRAADVVLKERRPLVMMVRETPLNLIHLRNMTTITEAGGTIFPPVPAFYSRPQTIGEIIDHSVGRALDQFNLHTDTFPRWTRELREAVSAKHRSSEE
ncbi:MAG: UbiX family flavin prenyltransferase [Mycolicibacterium sp.]|uniref:UbiX family flavin prenyltransferase n=1 Tax=Mycolicibacterium sp. TaxID=2320850 RepID=UPI003D0A6DB0